MKIVQKTFLWLIVLLLFFYLGIGAWYYFSQEKMIFKSVKLPASHFYAFDQNFEERYIAMSDGIKLNGVLFKADSSKGLILWFPGGRGVLDSLGKNAHYYTDLHYDIFMLNFRSYGKSEGTITSEAQFLQDLQAVFDYFKKEYGEQRIVIHGYSFGSGPAAQLASKNHPKMLMLLAPYYSYDEMIQKSVPYLPISLFKYKFNTAEGVKNTSSPIVIIHGQDDKKINVEASLRMKPFLKPTDELIILENQPHERFIKNPIYLKELKRVLD